MYSLNGVDPSVSRKIQQILKILPPQAEDGRSSSNAAAPHSEKLDLNSLSSGNPFLQRDSFNGASATGSDCSENVFKKFQDEDFLESKKSFKNEENSEQIKRFRKFQDDERNFRFKYEDKYANWNSFRERDEDKFIDERPQRSQSMFDFAQSTQSSQPPDRKFEDMDHSFLSLSLDRKWNPQPEGASRFLSDLSSSPYPMSNRSSIRLIKGSWTWEGSLPQRRFDITRDYSKKVFIGGVPRDITEEELLMIFGPFKDIKIEWPSNSVNSRSTPKGYLYIIFNNHSSICNLLAECIVERHGGCEEFNYYVPYKRFMSKPIQVIPWRITDSQCCYCDPSDLQNNRMTVFVGALHGRLYAEAIGSIFEQVFHNVIYVEIDTDRYKYPIGSGRVTFSDKKSYQMAIKANYICIETEKFSKKIQIEPYIEDQVCGKCKVDSAPNFCKQSECFEYYCNNCWLWQHSIKALEDHRPVRRKNKVDRSF